MSTRSIEAPPFRIGRPSRPLAVRAILGLVFGTLAIGWPRIELGEFILLFGAYIVLDGLASLAAGLSGETAAERWGFFAEGAVSCVLGVVAIVQPFIPVVLVYVAAAWGVITGILEIVIAAHLRASARSEWMLSLAGISSIFLGMLLMTVPAAGSAGVIPVIAAYAFTFSLLMFLASRRMANGVTATRA
jgi:uncharacterized membrane protein HdeD (DUF308 family)